MKNNVYIEIISDFEKDIEESCRVDQTRGHGLAAIHEGAGRKGR